MNIFQAEIDRLKSGIAEALPGVIVRGSLIDHESLRRDELQNGVITVLLERIENDGDWRSKLRLLASWKCRDVRAMWKSRRHWVR